MDEGNCNIFIAKSPSPVLIPEMWQCNANYSLYCFQTPPVKDDELQNRLQQLETENGNLKKEVDDKDTKIADLERNKDTGSARELARLKTKYENLQREKDMVVTEKLAMETEQSIILKENEFLKKMKASAVSKREAAQHIEDKELAEQARDEAVRESQKLKREVDDLQVFQMGPIQKKITCNYYTRPLDSTNRATDIPKLAIPTGQLQIQYKCNY